MDKTIRINLAGVLFQLEEDAYKMLREYLHAIGLRLKNTPEGNETLEDIESRIAEIFQSQKSMAGVITRENVNAMMAIIGRPEDFENFPPEEEQFRHTQKNKRLFRNPNDAILGGICSGTGSYLNIDPVWIRILFAIFSFFFGIGIFLYIALWIALPKSGLTDNRYIGSSIAGNAINEIFRALGKVVFVILRVLMIILGIALVLAGFLAIIAIVMVIFFKFPASVTADNIGLNIFYLKDFVNLIVDPSVTPWILVLAFLIIAMPMLALIYWGVKSIIWFRAKDGIFSLAGFLIWIASIAVLAMILLNEGVSFSQTGKSVRDLTRLAPDTLHVLSGRKISDLRSSNYLSLPGEDLNFYFDDDYKELDISPDFDIWQSEDKNTRLKIRRGSTGRTRSAAIDKANELVYNYSFSGDSVILDEYFTVPSGKKWSFDNIEVDLSVPDGTVIHFDDPSGTLWHQYTGHERHEGYDTGMNGRNGSYWKMTDGDLTKIEMKEKIQRQ